MEYKNIQKAKFISRPNRFIANVEVDGNVYEAHVKNTGRCKELLVEGADVYLQEATAQNRRTKYDLISVYKEDRLINIDSQAPNKVFEQWVTQNKMFGDSIIKSEVVYQNSRFDFYIETQDRKIFVEVKGVTLEDQGVVSFPDAPTQRGVKHINELVKSVEEGYEAYVVFIIQMDKVKYFTPNDNTHKEFGDTLRFASSKGVNVLALDCQVTKNSISAKAYVEVRL